MKNQLFWPFTYLTWGRDEKTNRTLLFNWAEIANGSEERRFEICNLEWIVIRPSNQQQKQWWLDLKRWGERWHVFWQTAYWSGIGTSKIWNMQTVQSLHKWFNVKGWPESFVFKLTTMTSENGMVPHKVTFFSPGIFCLEIDFQLLIFNKHTDFSPYYCNSFTNIIVTCLFFIIYTNEHSH